jgi:hypothetical protein
MEFRKITQCIYIPVTNETNMSAFQLGLIVPVGSVEKNSLVFVKSRNSRPSPVIQDSASIDEDIAMIRDLGTVFQVGDLDIVSTFLVIPVRSRNLMLRLDVIEELVFSSKRVEVGENFLASRVNA